MRATAFVLSVCLLALGVAGCKKKPSTAPPVAAGPDQGQMPPWQGGPGGRGPMARGPGGWPGGPGGEQPPAEPYTGPFAAGHQVFVSQGCVRCHRGTGQGGGGGMPGRGRGPGGPDLSEVGAKHPRDWIIEHVRHAKGHNLRSRMPDYGEDKISATDMNALADYLASLKGN
jgi:mono/diheme cytochrome c family protein